MADPKPDRFASKPTPEEDAKGIIAAFTRALEQAGQGAPGTGSDAAGNDGLFIVHTRESMRTARDPDERQDREQNDDFITLFFANAPRVQGSQIIMEKKQW